VDAIDAAFITRTPEEITVPFPVKVPPTWIVPTPLIKPFPLLDVDERDKSPPIVKTPEVRVSVVFLAAEVEPAMVTEAALCAVVSAIPYVEPPPDGNTTASAAVGTIPPTQAVPAFQFKLLALAPTAVMGMDDIPKAFVYECHLKAS